MLPVAGAFHTRLMRPAAKALSAALAAAELRPPRIPVYSNVTGRPFPFERSAAGGQGAAREAARGAGAVAGDARGGLAASSSLLVFFFFFFELFVGVSPSSRPGPAGARSGR